MVRFRRFFGRRRGSARKKLARLLAAAALFCLFGRGMLRLNELIGVYAEHQCSAMVAQAVLDSAAEVCPEAPLSHRSDGEGRMLLALDGDAVRNYQSAVSGRLNDKLRALQTQKHSIPLGTILDSPFLLDRGPRIPVRFVPLTSAAVSVDSSLQNAGVNQVLYRISMEIRLSMTVLLPGKNRELPLCQRIILEETLIAGKTPALLYGSQRTSGGTLLP